MANIELYLEHPLWLLLLIPAAVLLLVIYLTMKKQTRQKGKTVASLILHAVISVILVLLAAGLTVTTETDRQSTVILLDISESTAVTREEMTATCESLLTSFDDGDLVGVVAFGQDRVFLGKQTPDGSVSFEKADASGSDIASAMYYAVSLMDRYTHKRIILLSDGKETAGDALYAAKRLAEEGVRIDTMYYDTNGQAGNEVQINRMSTTGGSYMGDDIKLFLSVQSNFAGPATVSLYEGETLLEDRPVTLVEGVRDLTFDLTAETSGIHSYRAVLSCDGDTETRNNEAFAALRTYGETSVLIVAADPTEANALKAALATEAEVTVVPQTEVPTDLPTLCQYDGIYLMNADAEKLPTGFDRALDTVVKVYGKSVCYVGGDQTFSKGHMADTLYESMVPVEFGADDGKSTALVIVIDASRSMVNTDTNYLELAKIGAIQALETLHPNDYVGIVSFSQFPEREVPMTLMTAENKEYVKQAITSIQHLAGTFYYPAIDEAYYMLMNIDAGRKHVIFLSDGEPYDEGEASRFIKDRQDVGITVSTIGMNESDSKLGVLKKMAEYGNGTYTYVKNALDLPNIIFEASESVSSQYAFTNPFTPTVAHLDELTEGLKRLPTVKGYVGARAKEDATVYLTSERGDPVYVTWAYGEGTVSCFTTDLSAAWCGDFLADESGKAFVRNALSHTYPEVRYDSSIIPTVTVDGGRVTVTARIPEDEATYEIVAKITGKEKKTVLLERISATDYEGSTTLGASGEYEITISWKERGKTIDETTTVFAVAYSGEYDLFREGDSTLLSEIAASTDGFLDAAPHELAMLDLGTLRSAIALELPLCIMAVVIMLVDIIIRRLTWADVKRLFVNKRRAG